MNTVANTGSGVNDTVVFWFARDLAYGKRMLIAFGLILLGLLLQWYTGSVFSGVIPLIAGNALLLVKGYDNRVEFKGFDPAQQWQSVEASRLLELKQLDKKMKRWDRSFIDITNGWGIFTFLLLGAVLWVSFIGLATGDYSPVWVAIPVDMAILFLPHWFTGTRRILRMPGLLIKAELLGKVMEWAQSEMPEIQTRVLMLLKGKEKTLPQDIKIKLAPKQAPDTFLGLYGQVVINDVQGKSYPYFYMVLVTRPGLGLEGIADNLDLPDKVVAEFKPQDDVEILVLRQYTTKTSGYHTDDKMVQQLLRVAMKAMGRVVTVS